VTAPIEATVPNNQLTRSLGPVGMVLLVLSLVSPAGSVLVPGADIVNQVGGGALIAFAIATPAVLASSLLGAELYSAFPNAGGLYAIAGRIFGEPVGIVILALLLAAPPAYVAMFAIGSVPFLQAFLPSLPTIPVALALTAIATATALLNIRTNAVITGLFLLVEIATLTLLAGAGAHHPSRDLIHAALLPVPGHGPAGLVAIGIAAVSANWAISGASQGVYFSEEMRHPRQLFWVISISALLIAALEVAAVFGLLIGVQNTGAVLGQSSPFSAFIAESVSPGFAHYFGLAIAAALFNALIAMAVAYARIWFASGRDGVWPHTMSTALALVHPRLETPWVATLALGTVAALFCLMPFHVLVVYSAGLGLLCDFMVPFCVLKARRTGLLAAAAVKAPALPLLFGVAMISNVGSIAVEAFDPDAGRPGLIIAACIAAAALVYYTAVLRRRPGRWLGVVAVAE
jgi:amino acid transporter